MSHISLLSALTQGMRWHQQRQSLLAQNVANADTPGYKGRDLKPLDFSDQFNSLALTPVSIASTGPMAIPIDAVSDGPGMDPQRQPSFEITPEGNGVTIEDEMMKVTANQMDYQTITSLYTKSLQLIKTAIGQA